jgi:tetratricopeptide (TPR) repeat protein
VRAARLAAVVICMAVSTALGAWYLCVRIPEKEWLVSCTLGREALGLGRFSQAERHFLAALEEARAFGEQDRRLAESQFLMAQALAGEGRQTEALALLERSMAIYEKAIGANHPEFARVAQYYATLRNPAGSSDGIEPLPIQVR